MKTLLALGRLAHEDFAVAKGECSKKTDFGAAESPNILTKRVLFAPSEFHSASKQATT
jgi:hypothetical protein